MESMNEGRKVRGKRRKRNRMNRKKGRTKKARKAKNGSVKSQVRKIISKVSKQGFVIWLVVDHESFLFCI